MCIQADVYRARAKFVMIASKSATDEHRELWQKIAAAYEDLARNEEWLRGESGFGKSQNAGNS